MKSKLPLMLLGFVIFSTAVLTLFAARSLQQDEVIAQRKLDERAARAASTASSLVRTRLLGEVDQVRNAMADAAASGGDLARVSAMAARMEHSRQLVRRVYLFMNPWGFVWPSDAAADAVDAQIRQDLVNVMRVRAASANASDVLAFSRDGHAYLFGATEGRKELYVGFEVAMGAFSDVLRDSLRAAEGGGVLLGAEGGGVHIPPGVSSEGGGVVVRDSMGRTMAGPGEFEVLARSQPRAVQDLAPPFDRIHILAYNEGLDEVLRSVAVRNQLTRWGIVMLALGIIGGAGLLINATRKEVQQARSGSDVALGVSHDLRTPIASVKMLAESLLLGHVAEPVRQREFLQTIVDECERLSQLTERVLFLFRFGQDAVQYLLRPSDLVHAVRSVVEAFESRYLAAGLTSGRAHRPEVSLQVEGTIPPVMLDATAFSQVLLNLLDNAAKYGRHPDKASGARIEVHLGVVERRKPLAWRRRSWVAVTVRDQGAGIPRQFQRRIFTRFYRVPGSRDDNVSGVGLGLSVCRHVADRHGGWIELQSAVGAGSAFTVLLPVRVTRET